MKTLKNSLQAYKEIKALAESFTEREILLIHNAFYSGAGSALAVISQAPGDPEKTADLIQGIGMELQGHMMELITKAMDEVKQKKGEKTWTNSSPKATLQ